jgi:P27 family predicted phage terminase small subunit
VRGRKPTPASLHTLHGNPSKGPPRHEPQAPGAIGEPPDWLSPSQRAVWLHAVENAPAGVLRAIDGGLLAVYVVAADLHRQASVALQTEPLVTDEGKANPLCALIVKQALVMLKAASELGFSPTARARLGMAQWDEGEPESGSLAEWLRQGEEMRQRHAAEREAERTAKKKPN